MRPVWARRWQKINEERQFCHSWRILAGRRLSAMTIVWIVLATLALVGVVTALVRTVRTDGYGTRVPPDTSWQSPPRDAYTRFPAGPSRLG
ncbi:hypothetical protein CSO01_37670 [Cellulomonas soli]|uniref:Uncharacterized protein n=2 Tax=Cellulomonas soli TaxID=931535 RepID=A0A512PIT4_9CELL|nr:hypothetical protein CSO01_37670 [Cellulomonas soli]